MAIAFDRAVRLDARAETTMLTPAWPAWQGVAVLVVLSPVIEECVFRAGLQEWLLRHGIAQRGANLTTAVAFGVLHAIARLQWAAFAVALPALLIGELYGRRRLLRWCVLCHAAMNGAWLLWRTISGGTGT
ncbi:MAG: JDVT-CTERM system CAAX-type protease [Burkholderiales bacterium]|nr:JDVT-CTERM system CAAX-type protease [Burkholderiales bacterium]